MAEALVSSSLLQSFEWLIEVIKTLRCVVFSFFIFLPFPQFPFLSFTFSSFFPIAKLYLSINFNFVLALIPIPSTTPPSQIIDTTLNFGCIVCGLVLESMARTIIPMAIFNLKKLKKFQNWVFWKTKINWKTLKLFFEKKKFHSKKFLW